MFGTTSKYLIELLSEHINSRGGHIYSNFFRSILFFIDEHPRLLKSSAKKCVEVFPEKTL